MTSVKEGGVLQVKIYDGNDDDDDGDGNSDDDDVDDQCQRTTCLIDCLQYSLLLLAGKSRENMIFFERKFNYWSPH